MDYRSVQSSKSAPFFTLRLLMRIMRGDGVSKRRASATTHRVRVYR
jgi:hypothetical protein